MSVSTAVKTTPHLPHPLTSAARLMPIRFGEYLCEKELISDEQLLDALGDHWANGGKIGAAIARRGFMSEIDVERLAAEYHSLTIVEIE